MVSADGSQPSVNPWVSVVPSLVRKPLVTFTHTNECLIPLRSLLFFFTTRADPLARHLLSSTHPLPMPKASASKARSRARAKKPRTTSSQPTVRPHAAGIDVGATELYVAVPSDAASQPVRVFPTFTEDLHALADWLVACQVKTVALESTGVYWIPIFQILEARGLEVCLVNARHVKNVPGRKSDISDCQWLQYLHSVGLLNASFRPPAQVCAVRSLWRHRDTLIRYAASHVQHMQKALTQMNIQLANVISDLTGKTGLAIIDAILSGERDGAKLAGLRDRRIKADAKTIAKSLVGDWREEHLFTLGQARAIYAHYQQMVAQCDEQIAVFLRAFESKVDVAKAPLPPRTTSHARAQRNEPAFELRGSFTASWVWT